MKSHSVLLLIIIDPDFLNCRMDKNIIQMSIFVFLVTLLSSLASQAFALNNGAENVQDIRVRILSKYHPQNVIVEIDGESVYVGSSSEFPVILTSQDGAGITVQIPVQDVFRRYKGNLEIHQGKEELILINKVNYLSYVASATIGESGWVEEEAMKAQAVLIATNVLRRQQKARNDVNALSDISDLAYHQVYPGHNFYVDKLLSILKGMKHLPLLKVYTVYENRQPQAELVDAVFHAECGRRSFSSKEIWGVEHLALESRYFANDFPTGVSWQKIIRKKEIDAIFFTDSGRYAIQNLEGRLVARVNNEVYGIDEFRLMINRVLGWNTIESNDFEINVLPEEIIFSGYGRGHGVGLCQVQSNYLAKTGLKLRGILSYFYPSAILF